MRRCIETGDARIPHNVVFLICIGNGNRFQYFGRHRREFAVLAELSPLFHIDVSELDEKSSVKLEKKKVKEVKQQQSHPQMKVYVLCSKHTTKLFD